MKTITVESLDGKDVSHFYLDDLAGFIAYARHPEVDQDPDSMGYALAKIQAEGELAAAVGRGELPMRNPLTYGPFDARLGVSRGVVLWDDAASFLAGYGIELRSEPSGTVELEVNGDSESQTSTHHVTALVEDAPSRPRRDLLAPLIEAAQKQCGNPYDAPAVWAGLVEFAEEGKRPFLGVTDDGIKWQDGNDNTKFLSLKNLRDRINRQRDKAR